MSSGKRGKKPDSYGRQVIDALHEQFPKFTKVQLSLVRNPAYGLQMAPEAMKLLRDAGIPVPGENPAQRPRKTFKQKPARKKEQRITVRFSDEDKVRICEHVKASGMSMQDYLEKLIREDMNGKKDNTMLAVSGGNEKSV